MTRFMLATRMLGDFCGAMGIQIDLWSFMQKNQATQPRSGQWFIGPMHITWSSNIWLRTNPAVSSLVWKTSRLLTRPSQLNRSRNDGCGPQSFVGRIESGERRGDGVEFVAVA